MSILNNGPSNAMLHTVEDAQATDTFARPAFEGSGTFGREGTYSGGVRRLDSRIDFWMQQDVCLNSVVSTSYETGDTL